jgi:hypothetical protein
MRGLEKTESTQDTTVLQCLPLKTIYSSPIVKKFLLYNAMHLVQSMNNFLRDTRTTITTYK